MDLIQKVDLKLKSDQDGETLDFEKLHTSAKFDLQKSPPKPEILISIGRDSRNNLISLATAGNLSMILGEEKSRKTWLKSLIIGCCFDGESWRHSDFIKGHLPKGKFILNVDTEQGRYDAWKSAIRIPKIVGGKENPLYPENLINISLREYTAKQRLDYIEWLVFNSEYRGKIGIMFIDGFVDLINDFNNQIESFEVVGKLMRWSTLANMNIFGVLHTNPGTDKGRGHFGTILQQKCESVLFIKKEGDVSTVTAKRMRNGDFEGFELSIGSDYLPYANTGISDYQPAINVRSLPAIEDIF